MLHIAVDHHHAREIWSKRWEDNVPPTFNNKYYYYDDAKKLEKISSFVPKEIPIANMIEEDGMTQYTQLTAQVSRCVHFVWIRYSFVLTAMKELHALRVNAMWEQ